MNEKEATKAMRKLSRDVEDDLEKSHYEADHILCEFLRSLGYIKLADAYDDVGKWYA